MVDIVANPEWKSVRVLERDEVALGGVGGNMNEQATALVARTELLMQEKADTSDIIQGQYSFSTLAEFDSKKSSIPPNSVVIIDETGTNQGTNTWDGTTLTKSAFDPLTQAKNYTDSEVLSATTGLRAEIIEPSSNLFNDETSIKENKVIGADGSIVTATFELCNQWWIDPTGVPYDVIHQRTLLEALVNWMLINLNELKKI